MYKEQVMCVLQELAHGRTSVFVAHRLSTVQRCDKIVVMADGKVVEQVSFPMSSLCLNPDQRQSRVVCIALQHSRTGINCCLACRELTRSS